MFVISRCQTNMLDIYASESERFHCTNVVDVVEHRVNLTIYMNKLIEKYPYLKFVQKIPKNPKIGYTIPILSGIDENEEEGTKDLIEYVIQKFEFVSEPSEFIGI